MRRSTAARLCFGILVVAGCTTLQNQLVPDGGPSMAPAGQMITATDSSAGGKNASNCRRYVETTGGERICIDELIAALYADQPRDNDGDGIPNLNDDDIDGDGIPNGYDLDVDGDGIPNSEDDDIDDDGVPNADDVDIDGDFLRNRWDPDMDGDLLYNGIDPDADADGKLTFPETSYPTCGPVELFNDPEACGKPCVKKKKTNSDGTSGNTTTDSGGSSAARANDGTTSTSANNQEDKCKDRGKQTTGDNPAADGMNQPLADAIESPTLTDTEQPTATEVDRMEGELDASIGDGAATLDEFRRADSEASEADVLDAAADTLNAVASADNMMEDGALVGTLTDAAANEFGERQDSIRRLSSLPDVDLSEATELTDRLAAADSMLPSDLGNITSTAIAAHENFNGASVLSDTMMAVIFTEIADEAEIPPADVAPSIAPTARVTNTLGDSNVAENVWQIVVDQVSAYQNDDGSFEFSLPRVAVATERIAGLIESPTIESVGDSLASVLKATSDRGIDDPVAVVDRLEQRAAADPGFDLSDGVSEDEANSAADEVLADRP